MSEILTKLNLFAHHNQSAFHLLEMDHSMAVKSRLMMAITDGIRSSCLTQKKIAELLGVSQPRISSLMNGEIDKFSCDALIDLLYKFGISADVTFRRMV